MVQGVTSNTATTAMTDDNGPEDTAAVIGRGVAVGDNDEVVDYEAQEEDERPSARDREQADDVDVTASATAVAMAELDSSMNAVLQALSSSLQSCRNIYKTVIGNLLTQLAVYRPPALDGLNEQTAMEASLASFQLSVVSLLCHVLRSLHCANRVILTADLKSSILETSATVIPDSDEEEEKVSFTAQDLTVIDSAAVEAVVQSIETQTLTADNHMYRQFVDSVWRSFLDL